MTERIDGEFHYATAEPSAIAGNPPMWSIFRTDDDEKVWARQCAVVTAESHMRLLDRAAKHFIQQGREAALAEVDAAAEKLATGNAWKKIEVLTADGQWQHAEFGKPRRPSFTQAVLDAALLSDEGSEG